MPERDGPAAYALGRQLDVDEALMLARRATFDPGQFTKRVLYREGEIETLERWQARAVLVALAAVMPDDRWSDINRTGPHVTDYERAELQHVLPAPPTRTFRLQLAEKPRDILVHLVDHGPATAHAIDNALSLPNIGIYAGGLTLLRELGLATGPVNEHDHEWKATEEGRLMVLEARAASEVPDA